MSSPKISHAKSAPQIGYASLSSGNSSRMDVSPPSSPTGPESDSPRYCSSESSSSTERSRSPFPTRIETFTGRSSHPLERISRLSGGGCLDCSF